MKKSRINPVGKKGKANKEARDLIAEIAMENGMVMCEMNLDGCQGRYNVSPAHRHKRDAYKGNVKALADINQWLVACLPCHMQQEGDRVLTEELFVPRRGEDNLEELLCTE